MKKVKFGEAKTVRLPVEVDNLVRRYMRDEMILTFNAAVAQILYKHLSNIYAADETKETQE